MNRQQTGRICKIHVLLGLGLLLCASGFGQDRFFTFVDGWRSNVALEHDYEYVSIGLETTFAPGYNRLVINKLNSDGIIGTLSTFEVDSMLNTAMIGNTSSFMFLNDSIVLIPGVLRNEDGSIGSVYRYNLTSEVMDVLSTYDLDSQTRFDNIEQYSDSTFLVLALQYSMAEISRDSHVNLINNDGTLVWTSDLLHTGQDYHECYPVDLIKLSDGKIAVMLWEIDNDPPNTWQQYWRVRLTLLDEEGHIVWNRYPGDNIGHRTRAGALMEKDGGILTAFSQPFYYDTDGDPVPVSHKLLFEQYDLEGNIVANDSLVVADDNLPVQWQVNQIEYISDGNILLGGTHVLTAGFLAKVTPDLETIWFHEYSPHEYEEGEFATFETDINNFVETTDGGFLCTGMFLSQPNDIYPGGFQSAIALKVDEYGCLVENCLVGLDEHSIGKLILWPNPTTGVFNLEIPDHVKNGVLWIFDSLGRTVLSKEIDGFGLEQLHLTVPAGLYQVVLDTNEGYYHSKLSVQ